MRPAAVRACAKVNLCLRVLGRRPDGYHNVETVLHTIDLWDEVRLTSLPGSSTITVTVDSPDVPADGSNTCWRAAKLLAERVGVRAGVAIALRKSIPAGAGLGGGSSDAAATLAGLARLWNLSLPSADLEAVAAQIGADVPFFLRGGCCLARGRGEELEPLPDVALWLVVVVPELRVATSDAYAALERRPAASRPRQLTRPVQRMVEAIRTGDAAAIAAALCNDFESLPLPGVEQALRAKADLMKAGCLGAGLSGSGSAVFGLASDGASAERAAADLRSAWAWVQVVPTTRGMLVPEATESARS